MRRILLVRHAECDMNLELTSRVGGRSNHSPLTTLGVQQARCLGRHLHRLARHESLGPVYCSVAVRASETARLALMEAATQKLAPAPAAAAGGSTPAPASAAEVEAATTDPQCVIVCEEIQELSQGAWEGQLRSQCYTPEVLQQIDADPWNFAAPGGESQKQVEDRMVAFIRSKVLPGLQPGGPPAVVVTHGLAIKCVLRHVLDSKPQMSRFIRTDNTSITEVAWREDGKGGGGWEVLRVNDTTHLHMDDVVTSRDH